MIASGILSSNPCRGTDRSAPSECSQSRGESCNAAASPAPPETDRSAHTCLQSLAAESVAPASHVVKRPSQKARQTSSSASIPIPGLASAVLSCRIVADRSHTDEQIDVTHDLRKDQRRNSIHPQRVPCQQDFHWPP